ncbi:MAG: FAD-dependent oxidoreductase, partial [Saprospiraceae bacterium]|nr:FAD-dependent oxidoreductase [Saprospiraceae bacterium]
MSNTLSNSVDYIIVGLGLAGINLCCELERGGKNYLVFDDERSPASFKAAGLINPITGRNYAKSWRIDELIPVALENYHFLNEWLEGEYIIPLDIRRALNNISEENKWASRFGETGYKPYLTDQSFYDLSDSGFCDNSRSVRIDGAYQVRTKKLTINFKDHLIRTGRCLNETFDFSSVDYGHSTYKGIEFDNIVCCEGALGKHTPFDYVPIIPNLGEVLHVELAKTQPSFAFKKKVFVVPQEGGYYWVGGT